VRKYKRVVLQVLLKPGPFCLAQQIKERIAFKSDLVKVSPTLLGRISCFKVPGDEGRRTGIVEQVGAPGPAATLSSCTNALCKLERVACDRYALAAGPPDMRLLVPKRRLLKSPRNTRFDKHCPLASYLTMRAIALHQVSMTNYSVKMKTTCAPP